MWLVRSLIVAEAGVNHDGELSKALELVDAAAEAGADICKFQIFEVREVLSRQAEKAPYQLRATMPEESLHSMLRRLQLSREHFCTIADHCRNRGIEFLATAFDLGSLDFLISLGPKRVKVPSGEVTNAPLLRAYAACDLPLLLSTGMSTMDEVRAALRYLNPSNRNTANVTILHCTSEYPAPIKSVNLRAMCNMAQEFGLPVGYSDHTLGWEVPVAAVALGAQVVEKHITLDPGLDGPDHAASLDPKQFAKMVTSIRIVEKAMGTGEKVPDPVEEEVKLVARRSIVASRPIALGQVLVEEDLAAKRPATGLSPMLWDKVIGTVAKQDYAPDDLIEL